MANRWWTKNPQRKMKRAGGNGSEEQKSGKIGPMPIKERTAAWPVPSPTKKTYGY